MNLKISTYQLLQPIIDAIDKTIVIDRVTGSAPAWTIATCSTLWAMPGFSITIGSNDYTITSVVFDESITVTGDEEPDAGSFELYGAKFYHGTIRSTEEELSTMKNNTLSSTDKMPLIWLHEPCDEEFLYDPLNPIERNSTVKLFFMNESNFDQWTTEDHYLQAIRPVRSLISGFFKVIENSKLLDRSLIKKFNLRDLPRFGRYTGETGNKVMFSAISMSGTSLDIIFPFYDQNTCDC